jgi:hypothetical protein
VVRFPRPQPALGSVLRQTWQTKPLPVNKAVRQD